MTVTLLSGNVSIVHAAHMCRASTVAHVGLRNIHGKRVNTYTEQQVRSQKLNKEETIPSCYPPPLFTSISLFPSPSSLPLRSRTLPPIAQAPAAGPAAKRIWPLKNASSNTIFGSFVRSCYRQYHRSYNEVIASSELQCIDAVVVVVCVCVCNCLLVPQRSYGHEQLR